jgi:ribosomal protein S1
MTKKSLKFAMIGAKVAANKKYYSELDSVSTSHTEISDDLYWSMLLTTVKPKTKIVDGFKLMKQYNTRDTNELIKLYSKHPSFKNFEPAKTDTVVDCRIVGKTDTTVTANIGKDDILLDAHRERIDLDLINVGDNLPLFLEQSKSGVTGSYLKAFRRNIYNKLIESIGTNNVFEAHVSRLIHGGYWLTIGGNEVFMPGSLASLIRLDDFTSIVGTTISVLVVGFEKGKVIASHRDYQKLQNVEESKKIVVGSMLSGKVTGVTQKGIFVELLSGVYGLLPKMYTGYKVAEIIKSTKITKNVGDSSNPISFEYLGTANDGKSIFRVVGDLQEADSVQDIFKALANSKDYVTILETRDIYADIQKGDTVDVYVKSFDDSDRIVLTQRYSDLNQWNFIDNLMQVENILSVSVAKITKDFVFITICDNVRGKIRLSKIPKNVTLNVDDQIKVYITKIDKNAQIVFCEYYAD